MIFDHKYFTNIANLSHFTMPNTAQNILFGTSYFICDLEKQQNCQSSRVVLIGFRAQHRAQPHRTFKILFNALYLAGLKETRLSGH